MVVEAATAGQLVAVAVDKDKGSHNALKWAVDNLMSKGQTLTLIHVRPCGPRGTSASFQSDDVASGLRCHIDEHAKEVFRSYRVYCTFKDVQCVDVVLEDSDIVKAVVEFAANSALDKLVVGSPSKSGFVRRFKGSEKHIGISKSAPDFCTVYVIGKGKVTSVRNAVRPAPANSPLRDQIIQNQAAATPHYPAAGFMPNLPSKGMHSYTGDHSTDFQRNDSIKSPFARAGADRKSLRSAPEMTTTESDISYVSSGRPSVERSSAFTPRMSVDSDCGGSGLDTNGKWTANNSYTGSDNSTILQSSGNSWSSEGVEAEMRRLKLELKQTMDMYSAACREALTEKQKATELHEWKVEEQRRLLEIRSAGESAAALLEMEKARCKAAMEAAEASRRIAEVESQKRINAELKALREAEEHRVALGTGRLGGGQEIRYRKYAIEEIEAATDHFDEKRKIGEGGYGPVFRSYLDHTQVAIKVLRPDAAQGKAQFQQEVEILSCIRHPHMVLLLGACPEYGCLVYEYMANGSLDDRLFRRGNTPPISWQKRFCIAAEIGAALLFLHQTKPEPLVHRDLKPANILLDRNLVSKISDVGLARLVPPSVANSVTQYLMTSTAGTFCYIDPEYQQTGMLGVKSDIYSLGVILLQLVTAREPMGLAHHVERSIERGEFVNMLDPTVPDWPVEEALGLAKMALQCAELRRKDRPDLSTVVLPELDRLRDFAEERMQHFAFSMASSHHSSPMHSYVSSQLTEEGRSDPSLMAASGSSGGYAR